MFFFAARGLALLVTIRLAAAVVAVAAVMAIAAVVAMAAVVPVAAMTAASAAKGIGLRFEADHHDGQRRQTKVKRNRFRFIEIPP